MWLSLIPGLGQIYNKQKTKGYIFLAVTILFLAYFLGIGAGELAKLVTLGTVRGQDNSLFILIRGAFHLIITVVYFLFYALNIKDAGTVAKRINNGIAVPKTLKEMVQAIYENGFPYLLIIPSYIAMTFAIIFPVLVTLMIAFTNYDFKHTAPTTLLDWIGFQNFTNMWTLSTFRLYICSWLDLDLGTRSFNSSNRTRYLDRYCCKPTIRKRKTNLWGYLLASLGCSSLHHYPNFLKYV